MKNTLQWNIARLLLLSLICLGMAAQEKPAVTASAPYAGATISDFKGKAGIQLPGKALTLPLRGEVLPPESVVNTDDGRLLLRLSDGSDILVLPHTRLVLKQPETSGWHYLQLMLGKVRSQIQRHLGGTPSFQMGTPSAVISVRGTVFDVEVDRHGNTEVDVEEGVVELSSAEGRGESVMVTAGFSSRVGLDSGPEAPRPTHDLRPQLDRPGRHDRESEVDDDAIKRLEASARDRQEEEARDRRDSDSDRSGSDSTSDPGRGSGSDSSPVGDPSPDSGKPPELF